MATATQTVEQENYLNANYGIKSWLLTTDHKRIAILYLISITFMFFVGGFFATMIRMELLTPAGDLMTSEPDVPVHGHFSEGLLLSMLHRIGGGTSDIQRDVICRGLGLPK